MFLLWKENMSYFCLVPRGAEGDEHLTLCWRSTRRTPEGWGLGWQAHCLNAVRSLLPTVGSIYGTSIFEGKLVYLVALDHEIHKMRFTVFENLHQGITPWVPHITHTRTHAIGDRVFFDAAEYRP